MHWGRVVRDAVGIALLVGVGGLLVSALVGHGQGALPMPMVAASNVALTVVGFVVAGALTRELRGRHLLAVAVLVWLIGIVNVPLLGITLAQWAASALAVLVAYLLGGAIASALFRPHSS
jgi:hypothetical protein